MIYRLTIHEIYSSASRDSFRRPAFMAMNENIEENKTFMLNAGKAIKEKSSAADGWSWGFYVG
jgi:hypothetical protein